jgi:hypothetical protein
MVVVLPDDHGEDHGHEEHSDRLSSIESRLDQLANGKADREHGHPELLGAIETKAPAEHEHEGYATHEQLQDTADDLILTIDEDLSALEDVPAEAEPVTHVEPTPDANEKPKEKHAGMIW